MKKPLPLLIPLLIPLVLAACGSPPPPAALPRPAVVTTITGADAGTLAAYAGEVRARHEVDLAFRIGGKIVERLVNLGDRVRQGDVIARIDAGDATLSAAASAAQVAAAEADAVLARAEYERARQLVAKNFVSGTAVDTKRAQWQAAAARLSQARAQSGVAGNQLGYTRLLADRNGVITAVPAEPGQVVAAGQTVVRLADPGEREVLIYVSESRVAGLKPGQAAFVRPWNGPETTFAGRVREVAASADSATRTFAVRVSIADPGEQLPLGTTAAVGFPGAVKGALRLPLAALIQREGKAQVWVVGADNKVVAKNVDTDAFGDDGVLVKSGLAVGDRVVVVGAHALSPGLVVKPVGEQAPAALDVKR